MTEQQTQSVVVVAVGNEPGRAALTFAAAEAQRAGCGLHLVHVVHLTAEGPETVLISVSDLQNSAHRLMDEAVAIARDLAGPDVEVTDEVVVGGIVPSLVDAAKRQARLVVLEHRDLSRVRRVVTRSVSSGVAAHTRVPVISVPSGWQSEGTGTVTVGVDHPDRSTQVLEAAADAARRRGAGLRVLHTWNFPGGYDDIIIGDAERQAWSTRAEAEIRAALDGLGAGLEGVPVEIEVHRGHAADALVAASRASDLVVVGRHDPLVPIGSHLGPVARAVLREARCPVLLAEPRPAHRWHRRSGTGHETALT